jgi:hypothetical protein
LTAFCHPSPLSSLLLQRVVAQSFGWPTGRGGFRSCVSCQKFSFAHFWRLVDCVLRCGGGQRRARRRQQAQAVEAFLKLSIIPGALHLSSLAQWFWIGACPLAWPRSDWRSWDCEQSSLQFVLCEIHFALSLPAHVSVQECTRNPVLKPRDSSVTVSGFLVPNHSEGIPVR